MTVATGNAVLLKNVTDLLSRASRFDCLSKRSVSSFSRENALRLFWEYASRYDTGNGKIRLKIDHMLRVADLCATFARQIGLAERDVELAWLIGLLHDIGRFEQVKKYDTFLDGKSENHALLGVKEIKKERLAERMAMTDACNETICTAIACHNMLALPAMDERKLLFVKLLRDADKVDGHARQELTKFHIALISTYFPHYACIAQRLVKVLRPDPCIMIPSYPSGFISRKRPFLS